MAEEKLCKECAGMHKGYCIPKKKNMKDSDKACKDFLPPKRNKKSKI